MARGTQHRKRRPGQNARGNAAVVAAPPKHHHRPPQWQEELFFQRLRNHAKAIFFLLALVFALSFVFLGVGSGSTGISDALQNLFKGKSGGTSISSLEKKTQQHPGDAQAWRDLATAYETKHRTHDAIVALVQYTGLRPKDTSALAELATQYGQEAQGYANDYRSAQADVAEATPPGDAFAPAASTPFGKAMSDPNALKDPIAAAVQTLATSRESTAYSNYQSALANAEAAYKKIAKLTPNDANAQIQLGQAAQSAQDPSTAIAAYEKFLKLAPTDPLAAQVKAQLKSLKASTAASSSSSASK